MPTQSAMLSVVSSAASNMLKSVPSRVQLHPAIPIKVGCSAPSHYLRYQYYHHSTLSPQFSTFSRQKRIISRLYARHCLELAAAATLTRQAISKLEGKSSVSMPDEWAEGTEEFEARRKRLGESIGQLGSNKFTRVWAAGPASFIFPSSKSIEDYKWEYALWAIEKAGPTFIKLSQWASTRSDLFSADFCTHFAKLQAETRGHSWDVTHKILQNEFGKGYSEDLISLEKVPIGSGCIAQVYKGELLKDVGLHPAGSTIAIKIQHPHILHKVCVDFYILNQLASVLESVPYLNLDYLSIKDSVDQFRGIMLPQLDLRCEARNLIRFRKAFANDDDITFPKPITDITSDKILIESFVNGEPIFNYLGPKYTDKERQELATIGLSSTMKMVFLHDFVHGDLHPGNMIVDHNEKGNLRVNMIDCGLVVEMGQTDHENLVKILGALIKKDGYLAGKLMVDTSKRCQASRMDVKLFCDGIKQIVIDDEQNNFMENVGDYLAEICYLACKHKVKLEASFINAALACEIMEGIASSLYPDMLVQSIALPMVLKAEAMHGMKKFVPSFLD